MATTRHLRKAPITEALIDFRVERQPGLTANAFSDLKPALAADYPNVVGQRGVEAKLEFRDGKLVADTRDLGFQGLHFKKADGLTIAQFRSDGFTLNRLKPYTSWEELFPEALRLWQLYVDRASPARVTRVALRYINHLKLPLEPGEDFSVYLLASPPVAPELPQQMSSFLSRVVIHDHEADLAAIITQALEPITQSGPITVLLDVDVFRHEDLPTEEEALRPIFERLHLFKNKIFFSSLTERAVGIYE